MARLFDVLDEVQRTSEETYPPYNIERTDENHFQISVALAGFTPEEVALTVEQNVLTLEGRKTEKDERLSCIAGFQPGRLSASSRWIVDLVREIPEAMKPRRIAIGGPSAVNQIEATAA